LTTVTKKILDFKPQKMKNITKTKTRKQPSASFREILALTKKKPKYPRFGNWEIFENGYISYAKDLHIAVNCHAIDWIAGEMRLNSDNASHRPRIKEQLDKVINECLATGFASGEDWAIKFGGNK
jgi:hypothetical protein